MKLYMFRTVSLSIIRGFSLYTQQRYTSMSYRFADSLGKLSANLYDICHCCVYSEKLLMIADSLGKLSANLHDIYHSCVYSEKLLMIADSLGKLSANLYDIYHCCVCSEKLLMMDRGTVPKHVEFHSKNKFKKLVHLVGFIIINYHDARSHERQKDFDLILWT